MYMSIEEIEQELGVMQLSDSFFPTGIFATSNGLEFLFTEKKIRGMTDLIEIIETSINQQIGPSDCVALANVIDEANKNNFNKVIEADNIVFATKLIKEIRNASVRSGCFDSISSITERFIEGSSLMAVCGHPPVARPMTKFSGSSPLLVAKLALILSASSFEITSFEIILMLYPFSANIGTKRSISMLFPDPTGPPIPTLGM